MIPATQEQIEAAVARRSATEASRYLATIGIRASNSRCNAVIGQMIDEGRRGIMSTANSLGGNTDNGMLLSENVASCRALLKRHLETGRHWINDPARMASALREAGMVRS